MNNKKQFLFSSLGLLFVAFVLVASVGILSNIHNVRLDLTEDSLYTLSDGTLNILDDLEGEPLRLSFFYSNQVTENVPTLQNYARRVEEILEEYVLQGEGEILINMIDPVPFSREEDEAAGYGLQSIPMGNNDSIYFGLVGENSLGEKEIISFFNPEQESTLEYDISKLIYKLSRKKVPVVGVLSELPIFDHVNYKTKQVDGSQVIVEQLRTLFDVKRVYDNNIEEIESSIDLLIVVHPHLWPQKTLYAIDQFVLRGGRLLAFVDPDAEMDTSEQQMFGEAGFVDRSSSLEQLFDAWGVAYDQKKVVLDYGFAHSIPVTRYGQALPHVAVLGIYDDGLNQDEMMVSGAEKINVSSIGALKPTANATTTFTTLMQSSNEAQLMDIEAFTKASNHGELLRQFKADGERYTFAAFIRGDVKTAFPEGKPFIKAQNDEQVGTKKTIHLMESIEDIAVVIFADTDLLSDRMWVQVQDLYGEQVLSPWASNSDLIINILEGLSGSVDLIAVRGRGSYERPFERVDALERDASEKFRAEEGRLLKRLEEAESKIAALSGAEGVSLELNDKQKMEIEIFQKEKFEIRRNLREVQHQLNKDIERLGTVLKIINIMEIPMLLIFLALLFTCVKKYKKPYLHE